MSLCCLRCALSCMFCLTGCHLKAICAIVYLNTDSSLRAKWQPTRSHCACVTQPSATTVCLEIGKTIIAPLLCPLVFPLLIYFLVSCRLSWLTYSSKSERDNHFISLWTRRILTVMGKKDQRLATWLGKVKSKSILK